LGGHYAKNLTQTGIDVTKAEKERTRIPQRRRDTEVWQRREVTEKSAKRIELSCKWDAKSAGKSEKCS
jgi:hypothetical protein